MKKNIHQPPAIPTDSYGLSRSVSTWRVMWATVIKDLHISKRYIPNIIGFFVEVAIRMGFFLLLSRVVSFKGIDGSEGISGREMFIYLQAAILILVFSGPTLWGPIESVLNDLYNGTLEFLYSNPASRYAYYVGTVVSKISISLLIFIPVYTFLVVYTQSDIRHMGMILLVSITVLISLTAMGIMISLLAILWQRVTSITNILGICFEFIAGAYIHISVFPKSIQHIAYLLPYTWGYDLLRYYSFKGNWPTIFPVWQEWIILLLLAVGFLILSRYLLHKTEQRAKQKGLHMI